MANSLPSLAIRIVWFASPTICPSRITLSAGLSTLSRVCSLMIRNTRERGWPRASASDQRVSASATGFMKVIWPTASVAITASPMLFSVVK